MKDINTFLLELEKTLIIDPAKKEKIDSSIVSLQSKIWGFFQDRLHKIAVFGSYDRQTTVPGDDEMDVDILIVFKQKDFQPQAYLNQLKSFAEENYPRSEVYPDHPTIAIEMNHITFELVPAHHLSSSTFKIPAPRTKELKWISSTPEEFKRRVTLKDSGHKGFIIPLIKILKYWNVLNGKLFVPYELEKYIISRDYTGSHFRDYYFAACANLSLIATTLDQKKVVQELREKNRRLRAMEQIKVFDYIEQEFQSFLPFPK